MADEDGRRSRLAGPSVEREDNQPLVKPSTVVATGLASALGAFFTSRFGIAGTVLGTALMSMIITAGSALFDAYLERVVGKVRNVVPGTLRARPPRRSMLLGGFLTMAASFLVGMVAVTGVELSVGKSLSCWVWNECPTKNDGGEATSGGMGTRPSILGGGRVASASAPQPGGLEQSQQPATPHAQEPPDSPQAPQQRPRDVRPRPDAGPRDAPADQRAQQAPGGIRPDGQAPPKSQLIAPPGGSDEHLSPTPAPKERPPSENRVRPAPRVHQDRPP